MSGMDGPTVFKRLRASPDTQHIPVVFMTAKVQAFEIEQLRALGALGVVAKPFEAMTLSETIGELWERQRPA